MTYNLNIDDYIGRWARVNRLLPQRSLSAL